MSDLLKETQVSDSKDCPDTCFKPVLQKLSTRKALIGEGLTIRRALPNVERRMIGAWCFFDHFGPLNLKTGDLDIAPHPHIGLQTFTWTLHGEILHRDSLGSEQVIQPGQVNLMTAGHGIAHSEQSLPDSILHGVQLWIALPDAARNRQPDFAHYPEMPVIKHDNVLITLLAGELFNQRAPTKVYTPLIGLDLNAQHDTTITLPLNPAFEYGILPLTHTIEIEDESIDLDTIAYLGCGRTEIPIHLPKDARVLIIGGEPFAEEILLWWNFVARTKQEIIEATNDWNNHTRFGSVKNYPGGRLTAPEVPK